MTRTNTAKIVFDVNERESVEIPFEFYANEANGKTRHKAQKVKGSRAKFYYLDIKEYERRIRVNERMRVKREKEENRRTIIKLSKAIIKCVFQKVIGASIVFCAMYTVYSNYSVNAGMNFTDWFIAMFTIPVGLYMFFSKYFFFKKRT